jgi:hypothetical protein
VSCAVGYTGLLELNGELAWRVNWAGCHL